MREETPDWLFSYVLARVIAGSLLRLFNELVWPAVQPQSTNSDSVSLVLY